LILLLFFYVYAKFVKYAHRQSKFSSQEKCSYLPKNQKKIKFLFFIIFLFFSR